MSKHVTYRGKLLDMDAFRRENEREVAVGNMSVNAKGDKLENGRVVQTIEQVARQNHMSKTTIIKASLKGPPPKTADVSQEIKQGVLPTPTVSVPEQKKPVPKKETPKQEAPKQEKPVVKEVELPSGDIVIEPVSQEQPKEENDEGKSA